MTDFFYCYDPTDGYSTFLTEDEARASAEAALEYHRDRCTDGWHEDVESIAWGRLLPLASCIQTNVVKAEDDPTGKCAAEGWDFMCDYVLKVEVDELAALRAQVVELNETLKQLADQALVSITAHRLEHVRTLGAIEAIEAMEQLEEVAKAALVKVRATDGG